MTTSTGTVDKLLSAPNGGGWAGSLRTLKDSPAFTRIVRHVPIAGGLRASPGVLGALTASIPDLFKLDLGVILVGGWKKLGELQRYADTEKYGPDETILVELTKHTVSSLHKPTLDIVVNEIKVDTVPFELKVAAMLDGVQLRIRGGKILAASPGVCKGSLELKCEGYSVLKREPTPIRLPGTWTFKEPIALEPLTKRPGVWEL